MDKRQQTIANRLWNLRILVTLFGTNGVAQRSGKPNSHITAMAGPKPVRNMGDDTANIMEAAFQLPPGKMDQPPPKGFDSEDPHIAEVVSILAFASDADKKLVAAMSRTLVKCRIQERIDNAPGPQQRS